MMNTTQLKEEQQQLITHEAKENLNSRKVIDATYTEKIDVINQGDTNPVALNWITQCGVNETREINLTATGIKATSKTTDPYQQAEKESAQMIVLTLFAALFLGIIVWVYNEIKEQPLEFLAALGVMAFIYFIYRNLKKGVAQ